MGTEDSPNRWALRGDPALLEEAATTLRGSRPEQIFGARFPGEYVLSAIARLLESLAGEIRQRDDVLTHGVVSAAADLSGHVLRYLPELEAATTGRDHAGARADPTDTNPPTP
ncbi:hypothetical protein LWC35_05080 [Pseudonocardia kujensis]|uniref:hypothetical protein n=1 Tax=Pseudonocardia kujensis TaxID=1128675 RepID=UPI001E2CD81D|nr:hypothetical protein [Pseudonocardia kujensis]MCE0762286.1 hypothetical protein [Pseudonocardia kujensis]